MSEDVIAMLQSGTSIKRLSPEWRGNGFDKVADELVKKWGSV